MRQKITLQQNTNTGANSTGQSTPNWSTLGSYWAEVISPSGDQVINAAQLKATTMTKVIMRQLGINGPAIVPGLFRLQYLGSDGRQRNLNILSVVAIDNRNAYYEIMTQELYGQ
jgi:head-tail adaptor